MAEGACAALSTRSTGYFPAGTSAILGISQFDLNDAEFGQLALIKANDATVAEPAPWGVAGLRLSRPLTWITGLKLASENQMLPRARAPGLEVVRCL